MGGGVFVDVGKMMTINAGVSYTMYDDYSKSQTYLPTGFPQAVPYNDTYGKNTIIVAVGVDFSF